MKIRRLQTHDVAALRDATHDLAHPQTGEALDVVVVTGPPASGKTTLLETIIAAKESAAPYGGSSPPVRVARGTTSAKIEAEWMLSPAEARRIGETRRSIKSEVLAGALTLPTLPRDAGLGVILGGYAHDPEIGKVEYFHAGRALLPGGTTLGSFAGSESNERRNRFSKATDKYRALRQVLLEHAVAERLDDRSRDAATPRFTERFAAAFASLCSTRTFAGVDRTADGFRVRFADALGDIVDVDDLSDSERQAVIFAATFIHLELHHSIVLVDSPELFLPPSAVVGFATALTAMGRDNQLIFATSSPELVAAVEPYQVVRLGDGPTSRRRADPETLR
jgi:predicted ATPase